MILETKKQGRPATETAMQTQRILELDTEVLVVEGGRNALAPEEGLRVVRSRPGVYAARPPWRLLLVLPPGLEPVSLPPGGCCEAEVAWIRGEGGKRYRQITVTRLLPAPPADAARSKLTALIASAPRSDRPGGAREMWGPGPWSPAMRLRRTASLCRVRPGACWNAWGAATAPPGSGSWLSAPRRCRAQRI